MPITLDGTATSGAFPKQVIADAAGNFVAVWDDFSKAGGNNRSVFVARVSNAGQFIDLREIYSGFAIGSCDIARAGDRYLVSFNSQNGNLMSVLLDENFNQARNGPDLVSNFGFKPHLASNGDSWLSSGLRASTSAASTPPSSRTRATCRTSFKSGATWARRSSEATVAGAARTGSSHTTAASTRTPARTTSTTTYNSRASRRTGRCSTPRESRSPPTPACRLSPR